MATATLTKRLDALEQEAQARREAKMSAWHDRVDRVFSPADADALWRRIIWQAGQQEPKPDDYERLRETFGGEFVEWRDTMGAERVWFLQSADAMREQFAPGDGFADYLADRRRFIALLRHNVLAALGREMTGETVRRFTAWLETNGAGAIQDALRRYWLHGLRWEAVEPYLPGVSAGEFAALVNGLIAPSEDDLRAVWDAPRVPNELADALAAEWGL